MNLLIVNDDVIAVNGMSSGIDWKSCGIDGAVLIAYSAHEAMAILDREPVDLILCDIEMPGESGIELIRAVKNKYPDIDCVFLTCHARFEYAQEAIKLGCLNYILAPAPYDEIANTVHDAARHISLRGFQRDLQHIGSQWLDAQSENTKQLQGGIRCPAEIVRDTEAYIRAHLASDALTVAGLAERNHLNEDYFSRLFKREKGVSLGRYILQIRMELAAQLLDNPSLSMSAIASQCGFSNYSHFTSVFKRFYSCSPTEYRKRNVAL